MEKGKWGRTKPLFMAPHLRYSQRKGKTGRGKGDIGAV